MILWYNANKSGRYVARESSLSETGKMPPKIRELKKQLRRAGFSSCPGKGSHTVWTHPALPKDELTLSGNEGDDAQSYQQLDVRNILKKLREVQEK